MKGNFRLRQLAPLGITAVALLVLAACAGSYPNTTFDPHSDLGRAIDSIWDRLLLLGTIVFVLVEGALLFVVFRYRRRPSDTGAPPQTHGNATLEIIWTIIPALILLFIAVPTVRTIFKTQAPAVAGALEIQVIGHQWWWEFRYPEYNIVTANEIYIPTGRTVNFKMTSQDVIHSFWIPQLAGKRDVIANHTNYIWFTPDTTLGASVWNGFCTEYCGASHAKMRFRVFTVKPDQFASWVKGQQAPAAFGAQPNAPPPMLMPFPGAKNDRAAPAPPANPAVTKPAGAAAATLASAGPAYTFPRNEAEFDYAKPHTPVPAGLTFTPGLTGNAARGQQVYSSAACIGCHTITGNPMSMGVAGPNLTHIGSRATIGAGTFPNTPAYLALWIKNARAMKPGILMPTLGKNQYDPQLKQPVTTGGLDDQQIADIVAYLTSLK
ncbi:MAG TPA: cytochrome c oxidase subunit II [Gemmatimonadaceae bacterium]|jgi:cytochrome c oxidase subunit 2|nr:cytochrome c oxidase subunit II [Gemmatimonadaceae bacterium]